MVTIELYIDFKSGKPMNISFYKYHGCGNDFIVIDNRSLQWQAPQQEVAKLCDRHFGIGADGLMLLQAAADADFSMRYFNSDGAEASMCGNGGRCIVAFAHHLGLIDEHCEFLAVDGRHQALIDTNTKPWMVRLKMQDVNLENISREHYLDTGSPHVLKFVDDLQHLDVNKQGAEIRYSKDFESINGVNVNFLHEEKPGILSIRTYERGVESETLACGTGATAAAVFYGLINAQNSGTIELKARGGTLKVSYRIKERKAEDLWLEGPAEQVFKGSIKL